LFHKFLQADNSISGSFYSIASAQAGESRLSVSPATIFQPRTFVIAAVSTRSASYPSTGKVPQQNLLGNADNENPLKLLLQQIDGEAFRVSSAPMGEGGGLDGKVPQQNPELRRPHEAASAPAPRLLVKPEFNRPWSIQLTTAKGRPKGRPFLHVRVLNLATYHLHVTTLWTCDEFLHCSHNSRAEGSLAILAAT
jgi:hypothetical protein